MRKETAAIKSARPTIPTVVNVAATSPGLERKLFGGAAVVDGLVTGTEDVVAEKVGVI
jgi:hypothetical protein